MNAQAGTEYKILILGYFIIFMQLDFCGFFLLAQDDIVSCWVGIAYNAFVCNGCCVSVVCSKCVLLGSVQSSFE